MTDDPTAGHWQPPADQPIEAESSHQPDPRGDGDGAPERATPLGRGERATDEPRSPWAPPVSGPPPYGAGYGTTPSRQLGGPNPWAAPDSTFGTTDYIESPPRRRVSPALVIGIVVVVAVALVGGGVALFATNSGPHNASGAAVLPSRSALPQPQSPDNPSAGGSAPNAPLSPGASEASTGPLDRYLLAPSNFGAQARMVLINDGRAVDPDNGVTLDFCNYDYKSEALRSQRVQVQYVNGNPEASNEFVRYRSGGAASAFAELKKAVASCPPSFQEGDGTASHIEQIQAAKGLATNHVVLTFSVTTSGFGGAQTLWTTAVYQFDGDFFSGLYVYGVDKAQVQQSALRLGTQAAKHLGEAAAGKPGTGGGQILQGSAPQQPGVPA